MKLNKIKKHLIAAVLLGATGTFCAIDANAANVGPYIGGQLGFGNVHQQKFVDTSALNELATDTTSFALSSSGRVTGFAGRIFGGYQINPCWAVEMGYTRFHNTVGNVVVSATDATGDTINITSHGTLKTEALDLVGKYTLPLQNGFNVYGKAGAAYVRTITKVNSTVSEKVAGDPPVTITITDYSSETARKIYPTFGAGVTYDITQNLAADLSYTRIQKVGHSSKIQSTDFVGVGLVYSFS